MDIQKNLARDSCELMISGRIDGEGANRLETELLAILFEKKPDQPPPKTLYVNLANATFLCSAGLRALMQHARTMKSRQGQLLVSRPSPEAAEVLKMAGVYDQLVEKV
jgi:anti-anti-sigma factor